MKSTILVLVGIAVGAVLSVLIAPVVLGVGTGIGVATGMQAGACLTVEAAKSKGYITAEQVDEVLRTAADLIVTNAKPEQKIDLSGGDAQCAKVIDDLKKHAQQ
jgi:hypothetical protein